jgi:hypothetical protein
MLLRIDDDHFINPDHVISVEKSESNMIISLVGGGKITTKWESMKALIRAINRANFENVVDGEGNSVVLNMAHVIAWAKNKDDPKRINVYHTNPSGLELTTRDTEMGV